MSENDTALIVPQEPRNLTIAEVKTNVARVRALMKDVMVGPTKENPAGVHYGKIPGTPKPTLYQAGAELILMMFRLEAFPMVEDLSTPDRVHYRVKVNIKHQLAGISLGWGVGEASSDEEKYRWRKAVCVQEWDAEDPARRRVAYKKAGKESRQAFYTVQQVRTNPADVANTILKMALKRAVVGGARGVTAASDLFDVGAEDLSPEERSEIYGTEETPTPEPTGPAEVKTDAAKTVDKSGKLITDGQLRILRGQMQGKTATEVDLCKYFKVATVELLPIEDINDVMKWVSEQK